MGSGSGSRARALLGPASVVAPAGIAARRTPALPRPSNAPCHSPPAQLETGSWASDGLQSALDDYRRACWDAAATVRRQLRELAVELQARWEREGRKECGAAKPQKLQLQIVLPHCLTAIRSPLPLQALQTELVCAATIGVAAAALEAHTREALR